MTEKNDIIPTYQMSLWQRRGLKATVRVAKSLREGIDRVAENIEELKSEAEDIISQIGDEQRDLKELAEQLNDIALSIEDDIPCETCQGSGTTQKDKLSESDGLLETTDALCPECGGETK